MKNSVLIFVIFLSFLGCAVEQKTNVTKQNLRVLYVGGTSDYNRHADVEITADTIKKRANSFVDLLSNYFTEVDSVMGDNYSESMSANYDVTIFDSRIKPYSKRGQSEFYDGKVKYFSDRVLSEEFNHPALFIGETAELNGRAVGSMFDWY